MSEPIGYGLIGAGAFGGFCLEHYRLLDTIRPIAVADADPGAAQALAARFGINACETVEALYNRNDLHLIHLATPPMTHADLALRAFNAGKHVLCEKPLATTTGEAQQMVEHAHATDRILAVNLIMRYDPLCEAVKKIIELELLGKPLHGFFENYAKDQSLPPDHWFWCPEKSGGIFVEHGVHFFDLFAWWLGPGRVGSAHQTVRPGTDKVVDQVQCAVCYGADKWVNFYHGFTQAECMDRQETRLVFERGDLRLFEWIPTRIEIDCLATDQEIDSLKQILPHVDIESLDRYKGSQQDVYSRHKRYRVDGRYRLHGDTNMDKPAMYSHVLRQLLADQVSAIQDRAHRRRVDEINGLDSLKLAVAADHLARQSHTQLDMDQTTTSHNPAAVERK